MKEIEFLKMSKKSKIFSLRSIMMEPMQNGQNMRKKEGKSNFFQIFIKISFFSFFLDILHVFLKIII